VVGDDRKEGTRRGLSADERPLVFSRGKLERDRDHVVVGQAERDPPLWPEGRILDYFESQLLTIEVDGSILVIDVQAPQRKPLHNNTPFLNKQQHFYPFPRW